jgi:hypothetical protein
MGTGFLMGVNIFHGYGFGIAKPGGFVPVAISTLDVGLSRVWIVSRTVCTFFFARPVFSIGLNWVGTCLPWICQSVFFELNQVFLVYGRFF